MFQMLREESLERPRRSSTQIVQEILTEEKRQMDTIRRRREDEQQTNTKKKHNKSKAADFTVLQFCALINNFSCNVSFYSYNHIAYQHTNDRFIMWL